MPNTKAHTPAAVPTRDDYPVPRSTLWFEETDDGVLTSPGPEESYPPDEALGFDEEKRAKAAAKLIAALDNVQSRRRTYRTLALNCPTLPPMPCRVLCRFLEYADADLDDAFPRLATVAAAMGVSERVIKGNVNQLRELGWMRRVKFRGEFNGRRSSSGTQFLIPPGVISGLSTGWEGPDEFTKRVLQIRVVKERS